jgi:hypothetical protein
MRKLTLEEIQADAARRGGRCVSESYVDSLTLMEWECAQGHRWRAVAHSIRQGHWCKKCADAKLRHSVHALHSVAAERGGRCLAQLYSNSQVKLEWECKIGHRWLASFNSIKQGSWCPECKAGSGQAFRLGGDTKAIVGLASPD